MSAPVIVFVLCVVACVLGHVAILRSVIRARAVPVDTGVPRPKLLIEVVWALVPVIALAFLLTATWDRVRENAHPKPGVILKLAQ